jgi:esterase/lipase superfamily enzyme
VPTLCDHVHLPVQSGSTRVLDAMQRLYSREQYLERIAWMKAVGEINAYDLLRYHTLLITRTALEQLIEMLAANPNVKEINIVAHSMGNVIALETLRGMASRKGRIGAKVRIVALVAPDVGVDVFRTEMKNMGKFRPRFLQFASQDDGALNLSKTIGGGVQRIGAINPAQEPYKSELAQENVDSFDLTKLKGGAHRRAFEDITTVMTMLKDRLGDVTR